MSLTNRQHYLFRIDEKPKGWVYALAVLKRAAGTAILLAASSVIGWIYLLVSMPFNVWCREAMLEFGSTVFLLIFGSVILGAVMIPLPYSMLNKHFRIHHPAVRDLCLIIAIAALVVRIATNDYAAKTLVLPIIVFAVSLLQVWFILCDTSDAEELEQKSRLRKLGRINDQSTLMAIASTTCDEQVGLAAVKKIDSDNASLFREMAGNSRFQSIRQYACQGSSHDWEGCVCRRCGVKRDKGHDKDVCVSRLCGATRHDWEDLGMDYSGVSYCSGHQLGEEKHLGWKCSRCGAMKY